MTIKTYASVNGTSKELKKIYGSVGGKSRQLKKLYASVNGASKLIYTLETLPPYGTLFYKPTDSSSSQVQSVELQSLAEFNSLVNPDLDMDLRVSVGGGTVTVAVNDYYPNFIVGITIGSSVTSIPNDFLAACMRLNQPLIIPDNVTSIGSDFLSNCGNLNQTVTISNSVTSLGSNFMFGCVSFNQPLAIPSSVNSIGANFLCDCTNMTNTVDIGSLPATIASSSTKSFSASSNTDACYTTGIKIAGANRAAWLSRFPNRTSYPFRKLVDAGY